MEARKIKEGIYWVGAVDWDRRMFDDLIPLPDGTSYNAFLIQGSEKTVLIDTVDTTMSHVMLERLNQLGNEHIDYIITNHAEQDHSGTLPQIMERYPETQVVCTSKCKEMLVDLLLVPQQQQTCMSLMKGGSMKQPNDTMQKS
jgi:flavorubredoxin